MNTTTKIEDFLDLPPLDTKNETEDTDISIDNEILVVDQISTAEKVDASLNVVRGATEVDAEFDEIAAKALKSYEELMKIGGQVNDNAAGRIYETAAQMLSSALEAKKAKKDSKLKRIELLIKKAKIEADSVQNTNTPVDNTQKLDRNAMMKQLIDKNPELNPHLANQNISRNS